MSRAIKPVAAGAVCLLGAVLLVLGTLLLAAFGRDGTETVEGGRVSGDGAALVSDGDGIAAGPLLRWLGTLTLAATSPDGRPLFLGVADADDVFGYLDGVPYGVVAEASPQGSVVRPVPGRATAEPPSLRLFWTVSDTGPTAEVQWPTTTTDTRYVVMNVDGSPGVTADLVLGWRSDVVFPLGLGLLIAGAVLLLVGVLLLILWARRRGSTSAAGPPDPTTPTPGG